MKLIRTNSIGEFICGLGNENTKKVKAVTLSMNNPYTVVADGFGIDYKKLKEQFDDACCTGSLRPFVYELTKEGEAFMTGEYCTVRFSRDAYFIVNMNVTFSRKLTLKQALQHIYLFAMLHQVMINSVYDSDRNTAGGHSDYYFEQIVMENIPKKVTITRDTINYHVRT